MGYKNLILDDSVLDVDSWFPQSVIDEIVEVIVSHEKSLLHVTSSQENKEYIFTSFENKKIEKSHTKAYSFNLKQNIDYSDMEIKVA